MGALFSSLLPKLFAIAIQWLTANAMQLLFDAMDEAVESVLEKYEAKAKATPEKADDRRMAVLRKYFEGWKKFDKDKK